MIIPCREMMRYVQDEKYVILVETNPENETKVDEYQGSLANSKGKDKPSDVSVYTKRHDI